MKLWPPDYGLLLVYKFPEPSPHLVNLGKSVETITLTGVPVVVARLPRGREMEETVRVLRALGADEIVAGDVYIEDHLRYMERVAAEAGATLREPLWGRDPEELLYEIVGSGVRAMVIGVRGAPRRLLGAELTPQSVHDIVEEARRQGWDPLGERGEYHTIVLDSPVHSERLRVEVAGRLSAGSVEILRLA
jgi:uncharacterized protein (TIGR00290 family)